MHLDVPPMPVVPVSQRGEGSLLLRYEDVTQDGRLRLEPLSHGLGAAVWRGCLEAHPMVPALVARGVLPILSRLQLHSQEGPFAVRPALRCDGAYELLRTRSSTGEPRLRLDMGAVVRGIRGRTFGPPSPGDGAEHVVGEVFAEHVLTRPFAAKGERRVTTLPPELVDVSTLREVAPRPADAWERLPEGVEAAEDALRLDPMPFAFGLGHTDSNQHVNSLVYVRLLEEAALRRFAVLGWPTAVFAQAADVTYLRPFFAGDRARVWLRAYRSGDALGVVAAVTAEDAEGVEAGGPAQDGGPGRAHCVARLRFVP